jgi:hypothetical protein
MDWSPVPDDDWQPKPEDRDLYCNVYIDESSLSHRYLILGGLVVPLTYAGLFESDIIAARANTPRPATRSNGAPRVLKWEKVSSGSLDAYKAVVKTAFNFRKAHEMSSLKEMGIHCTAIDTSARPLLQTGEGDRETGFEKEFYFLCNVTINKRNRYKLFSLFPDRRYARRRLRATRDILNYGAYKFGDQRKYPFRRLAFADPELCQGLQVVDIFMGALAYRLNGHYDQPGGAPKKALCDYIWELCDLPPPHERKSTYFKRLMTWFHRP